MLKKLTYNQVCVARYFGTFERFTASVPSGVIRRFSNRVFDTFYSNIIFGKVQDPQLIRKNEWILELEWTTEKFPILVEIVECGSTSGSCSSL